MYMRHEWNPAKGDRHKGGCPDRFTHTRAHTRRPLSKKKHFRILWLENKCHGSLMTLFLLLLILLLLLLLLWNTIVWENGPSRGSRKIQNDVFKGLLPHNYTKATRRACRTVIYYFSVFCFTPETNPIFILLSQ